MKIAFTVGTLGVLLLLLVGLALWKGDGTFQAGLRNALTQGGKFLPMLLIAFLIMGFTQALLPQEFVRNWLSESAGFRGIAVAWLAGALTPAGSLVGLPLAAALFQAGVSVGVLITYLTSVAVLSLIRMPMEIGIYGLKLTALRIGASILLPPISGLIAQFIWKTARQG